jgi:hypothetical protein
VIESGKLSGKISIIAAPAVRKYTPRTGCFQNHTASNGTAIRSASAICKKMLSAQSAPAMSKKLAANRRTENSGAAAGSGVSVSLRIAVAISE